MDPSVRSRRSRSPPLLTHHVAQKVDCSSGLSNAQVEVEHAPCRGCGVRGVPSMLRCMSCWSFSKRAWDSATTGSKKGSTAFSFEYANTALTCYIRNNKNVSQKVDCHKCAQQMSQKLSDSFLTAAKLGHTTVFATILVVVDKLTKMTRCAPVKDESMRRRMST